ARLLGRDAHATRQAAGYAASTGDQLPCVLKDLTHHLRPQLPRERVLLAWMKRRQQKRRAGELVQGSVPELGFSSGQQPAAGAVEAQATVERNAAQGEHAAK